MSHHSCFFGPAELLFGLFLFSVAQSTNSLLSWLSRFSCRHFWDWSVAHVGVMSRFVSVFFFQYIDYAKRRTGSVAMAWGSTFPELKVPAGIHGNGSLILPTLFSSLLGKYAIIFSLIGNATSLKDGGLFWKNLPQDY